jgi:hypothetical protein
VLQDYPVKVWTYSDDLACRCNILEKRLRAITRMLVHCHRLRIEAVARTLDKGSLSVEELDALMCRGLDGGAERLLCCRCRVMVSQRVARGTSLYLPCGPGLLICEALRSSTPNGIKFCFARARTRIADSMIRLDQQPIAPAVGDAPSMLGLDDGLVLRGPEVKDGAA